MMETLAYLHLSVAHEEEQQNPNAYALQAWRLPSSAWIKFSSALVAISIVGLMNAAMAAYVRTNGSPLNVRSGPGGVYPVVGSLRNGASVALNGRSSNGWLQLSNGNWVAGGFIRNGSGGGGGGGTVGTGYIRTNGGALNVRSAPGGRVVYRLANGTAVSLNGRTSNGWSQLTNGNWVASRFIGRSGGGGGGGTSSGILAPGSRGSGVVQLQNRLKSLGYFSGGSTGYYGSVTTAAVKKFQAANGLRVDGVAGPATKGVLGI